MIHALAIVVNESHLEVTLHPDHGHAVRVAAKRILRMMRESSACDIGEETVLLSEAHERGDFAEVVHLFELLARRKVVFIQPVEAPVNSGLNRITAQLMSFLP